MKLINFILYLFSPILLLLITIWMGIIKIVTLVSKSEAKYLKKLGIIYMKMSKLDTITIKQMYWIVFIWLLLLNINIQLKDNKVQIKTYFPNIVLNYQHNIVLESIVVDDIIYKYD